MKQRLPRPTSGLLEEKIGADLLVYCRTSGQAHDLNDTCARTFQLCKQGLMWQEAVALLATEQGITVESAHLIVTIALRELQKAGLIEQAPQTSTRRKLLQAASLGVLMPAVASIFTPQPVSAVSTIPNGQCIMIMGVPCPGTRCSDTGMDVKVCTGKIGECECRDN